MIIENRSDCSDARHGCMATFRDCGAIRVRNRIATTMATAAIPISTGGYPKRANRIPAPAVAIDPASELQNNVIAAAVVRSLSGVSLISRLYSPGELIHCAAEKVK